MREFFVHIFPHTVLYFISKHMCFHQLFPLTPNFLSFFSDNHDMCNMSKDVAFYGLKIVFLSFFYPSFIGLIKSGSSRHISTLIRRTNILPGRNREQATIFYCYTLFFMLATVAVHLLPFITIHFRWSLFAVHTMLYFCSAYFSMQMAWKIEQRCNKQSMAEGWSNSSFASPFLWALTSGI